MKYFSNQAQASIPLMVTKKMKMKLSKLGYTDLQIKNMNPSQCWELLNKEKNK